MRQRTALLRLRHERIVMNAERQGARMSKQKTAAILAIGDELLSGRTRDANMHYLAGWLTERGVALLEARVVPDDAAAIGRALNALRGQYDYVFTSGGIGPTHDDITVDSIAAALGVRVIEHPRAAAMVRAYYTDRGIEVTPARLRMARTPEGAELIDNPVSGAPGVRIGNVFVMAGVPRIFQAMLNAVDGEIERGAVIHAFAATAYNLPESALADQLRDIQAALKGVSIGSYPIDGDVKGVTIVARSTAASTAQQAIYAVAAAMRALGFEPEMEDRR
jgi:molybdenum cofactor synthesis domain-containing protein